MYEAAPIHTFCHGIRKEPRYKVPKITEELQNKTFDLFVQSKSKVPII